MKIIQKGVALLSLVTILLVGFFTGTKAEIPEQTGTIEATEDRSNTEDKADAEDNADCEVDLVELYSEYKKKYTDKHFEIDEHKMVSYNPCLDGTIIFAISYFNSDGIIYKESLIMTFLTKEETQANYEGMLEWNEESMEMDGWNVYDNISLLSDCELICSQSKEYLAEINQNAFENWQSFVDMGYEYRGYMVDYRPKEPESIEPTMPLIAINEKLRDNIIGDFFLRFNETNGDVILRYDKDYHICGFETLVYCRSLKEAEKLVHDAIYYGGEKYYYTTEAYIEENSYCVHLVRNELCHLVADSTMYDYILYIAGLNELETYYDMRSAEEKKKYPLKSISNIVEQEPESVYDYNSNLLIVDKNMLTVYANSSKTVYAFNSESHELIGIYSITSYNSNEEATRALIEAKENTDIGYVYIFGVMGYKIDNRMQLYCQYTYEYCLEMTNGITDKNQVLSMLKENDYDIVENIEAE